MSVPVGGATTSGAGGLELAGVLDAIETPIVVVGRDHTLVGLNRAAAAAFGLSARDVGRPAGALAVLDAVPQLDAILRRVIAEEAASRRELQLDDRRFLVRFAPCRSSSSDQLAVVVTFTNITAFSASIEQAVYEREYTKAILNTVVEPIVVLDARLCVKTANRAFYALFGIAREAAQGVALRSLGDDAWTRSELWTSLAALVSGGAELTPVELARDFPRAGRRTVVLDARRLSRNDDTDILVTVHDITDRKRAEDELRRGQSELRDFVENATVGMHWVGPDGIIQWANRTELEMLGYERDEFVGHHIAEFHADAPVIENILARLARGETLQDCTARLRRKDGSIRDVLINSNVLWEGDRFVHTRCFTRDVTERKRAEQALRDSERRLREMIDALPAAIYTTDAEGRITHFNPACVALAGRVPQLGTDRWCVAWKLYDRDGVPLALDASPMAVALEEGRAVRGKEAIAERPDRTRVRFEPYPTPIRDAAGNMIGAINMLVDITERTRVAEALRENQRALEESDRRKDEFLATLAHELRNPLAPIRNGLHLLRPVDGSDPVAVRVHAVMERQVAHVVRLVDDLLEVSRISRGQIALDVQRVALATILEHAIESSQPILQSRGHRLEVALPPEPIVLNGDPVRLTQIFANLLNNAAKYSDRGGDITIRAWREGGTVLVSVRDRGVGIPADMLTGIFEMFVQVDNRGHARDGLGIGLSLVRSLVVLHGGSIEARSEGLGKGSELVVTLPVASAPSAVEAASTIVELPAKRALAPSSHRILVVDDNRDAADTMGMLLRNLEAEVRVEYDGASALAAVPEYRPDVVLLDLGMPGLDGYQVARRLRAEPSSRGLTLVALTGWGQEEDRRRTRAAGFDHHLVKPVHLEALMSLLTQIDAG